MAFLRRRIPGGAPRALTAVAALAALAALAGCDLTEPDTERGRQLFVEHCGACHVLAEAGTAGQNGPDLDEAFRQAREDGMTSATFEGVVRKQIAHPREASPDQIHLYMPADLVTGADAKAVSAYVADVAGVPGIEPPVQEPPELFAAQCGSCHTLEAAGTTATIGPDLDEVLPGQSAEEIRQGIVDPEAQTTPGFPAGVMPAIFEQTIPPEQLDALVAYLMEAVGG